MHTIDRGEGFGAMRSVASMAPARAATSTTSPSPCMLTDVFDNPRMTCLNRYSLAGLAGIALSVAGCASSGPTPLSHSVRHVQGIDRSGVFEGARRALSEMGYAVDHADSAAGVITAHPVAPAPVAEGAGDAVRLSSRVHLRRVAHVRVTQTDDIVNVYCRVVVEERTTQAHRMFQRERTVSDLPGDTPIEREAATTEEQNTVWQTIRRDKGAERRILQAILQQTSPDSS